MEGVTGERGGSTATPGGGGVGEPVVRREPAPPLCDMAPPSSPASPGSGGEGEPESDSRFEMPESKLLLERDLVRASAVMTGRRRRGFLPPPLWYLGREGVEGPRQEEVEEEEFIVFFFFK